MTNIYTIVRASSRPRFHHTLFVSMVHIPGRCDRQNKPLSSFIISYLLTGATISVFHVDEFDGCCRSSQKLLAKLQLLSVLLVCFHHDFWTVQAVLVVVNVVQFALNGPSSRSAACFMDGMWALIVGLCDHVGFSII